VQGGLGQQRSVQGQQRSVQGGLGQRRSVRAGAPGRVEPDWRGSGGGGTAGAPDCSGNSAACRAGSGSSAASRAGWGRAAGRAGAPGRVEPDWRGSGGGGTEESVTNPLRTRRASLPFADAAFIAGHAGNSFQWRAWMQRRGQARQRFTTCGDCITLTRSRERFRASMLCCSKNNLIPRE